MSYNHYKNISLVSKSVKKIRLSSRPVNVFVTGGAGYIGSVCVEGLLNRGHVVTVLDNCSEGHRQAVDPRARFIVGDLCDPESILSAVGATGPEAIMHFAAKPLVGESMENPYKYFHSNVYGALNLLDAAVEAGVKSFVFSSTCATYGIPERVPIDEETPQNPINPYGESKLMFEKILRWFDRIHGIKYVALRYFNAAGASEQFVEHHRIETHLIPRILAVALGHGTQNTPTGIRTRNGGQRLAKPFTASHLVVCVKVSPCFYGLAAIRWIHFQCADLSHVWPANRLLSFAFVYGNLSRPRGHYAAPEVRRISGRDYGRRNQI